MKPWEFKHSSIRMYSVYSNANLIAHVYGSTNEKAFSHAKLIGAAPDMLLALKKLLMTLSGEMEIGIANEAIRKAEGYGDATCED